MASRCMIVDGEYYFSLVHEGKNGELEQTEVDAAGEAVSKQVDFLRLSPRRELYLRAIVGMLIALEWMQRER
jgi:hypothetical protein